ncbi:MAG: response regulator [Candidatus Omnitrophica bacterium]|nr:response regulator [Candidatus Omnitrophota bacterium]
MLTRVNRKKILVVDDEKEVVDILSQVLGENDYDVLSALDGPMALKLAQSESPDMIILDIKMPRVDGFEVLRQLRACEKTQKIPVVMLSARGESQAILHAKDFHVADYLIKPLDFKKLLKTVGRFI